jgi:uncharacterized protein YoxC
MEKLEIILIVLSVAFLLFAGLSIPFLLQIWRTAKSMATTLQVLNQNLPAIMKNLEEITTTINRTTTTVYRQIEDLSLIVSKIQGTIGLVVGVEEILRRNVRLNIVQNMRTSVAVVKGIRVFLDHLLSNRPVKRIASDRISYRK